MFERSNRARSSFSMSWNDGLSNQLSDGKFQATLARFCLEQSPWHDDPFVKSGAGGIAETACETRPCLAAN